MQRSSRMIAVALMLILAAGIGSAATTPKLHSIEYTVQTEDGLTMYAWMTPSPVEAPAPLWVLLPMMGQTHESYSQFITALYERVEQGDSVAAAFVLPNILSLDLRGHGKSVMIGDSAVNFRTLSEAEFRKYPADITAVISRLLADKNRRIDRSQIIVIGASIGANSAIMLHGLVDNLKRVVMLSPGEDYRSLEPAEAVTEFDGDILIFAGKEDTYSWQSSEKLAGLNKEKAVLKVYPGEDHGTRIPNNNPSAMNDLIDWLMK